MTNVISLDTVRLHKLSPETLVQKRNEWYRQYMYLESAEVGYDVTEADEASDQKLMYEAEIRRRGIPVFNNGGIWYL